MTAATKLLGDRAPSRLIAPPPATVPAPVPSAMTPAELNLLASYRKLNQFGRGIISEFAAGLVLDFPAPVMLQSLRLVRSGGAR